MPVYSLRERYQSAPKRVLRVPVESTSRSETLNYPLASTTEADFLRLSLAAARFGVVRGSSAAIRSAQWHPGRPHSERRKTNRRPVFRSVTLTSAPSMP